MENLKLTSIRVSKASLEKADKLGRECGYYQRSFMLRVAIWLGLKFMKPGVLHQLLHMMWEEEVGLKCFTLEHVLRTAGVLKEDEQGTGL